MQQCIILFRVYFFLVFYAWPVILCFLFVGFFMTMLEYTADLLLFNTCHYLKFMYVALNAKILKNSKIICGQFIQLIKSNKSKSEISATIWQLMKYADCIKWQHLWQ